jgi:carbamoyl-phosphate synthase small subunit
MYRAMKKQELIKAKLALEDGSEYSGWAFGRARSQAGEVVFNTGMTGYPQSLTDPSYRGQILVSTYPLIGNYGVPAAKNGAPLMDSRGIPLHLESDRIQVSGFITQEICGEPSHHTSALSLSAWMDKNDVPGLFGVDTRSLTLRLRQHGVMQGKILVDGDVSFGSGLIANPVEEVSCTAPVTYSPEDWNGLTIAVVDCGIKANILRCLLARGVKVLRLPWNYELARAEYDGLFLSNGPGDPKACGRTIAQVRRVLSADKPIFGICLGNQIMALAAGGDTYKLPYGHRGQNQPCIELEPDGKASRRCFITSQNHGYAVRGESLPRGWAPWFVNANDGTVEGIRSLKGPFRAVQFHPEGCPGPRDTEFLIDRFLETVRETRR